MSDQEDIEKNLGEYRQDRDRKLPADRRLLPVHKDRLLAEARRRYSAQSTPGWSDFFRPAIRWAMVAAPLLILALAGYFWFQSARSGPARFRNENRMALLKTAGMETPQKNSPVPARKEEADAVAESATASAEAEAHEGRTAPAKPSSTSLPAMPPSAMAAGKVSFTSNEPVQTALLDWSGQYRSRSESKSAPTTLSDDRERTDSFKDQKNTKKTIAADESLRGGMGGKSVSSFSNFKLVQSADTITLVDEAGSTYVGRLVQPQQAGNFQPGQLKAKIRQKQNVSNLIQQANLVGTNQMTREVVSLVANFYVESPPIEGKPYGETESSAGRRDGGGVSGTMEAPKPESKPAAPELSKKQLADKLQQAQSRASNAQNRVSNVQAPGRVNVVLERIDLKNNRQVQVADAERLGE